MAADGRMRLTILGGFLGSGKTTWLRHALHEGAFARALVIVNEAAETPVDDALLSGASRLEVLAGGCVCCVGRDALIVLLRSVADERSRIPSGNDRVNEIVLETSGLADPGAIVAAIKADPVLVHHIMVGETIVTVDAVNGLTSLQNEALGRRQAEAADRIVITKVDAAEEGALKRLIATLRVLNPVAALSGATLGTAVALPDATGAHPETLGPASEGPPVFPTRLKLTGDVDWTAFTVWLSALLHARGDDVLRVKGVVRTPAGRLLLQSVRKVVQSPEILPEQGDAPEDDMIVVIGRGYRPEDLQRSLRRFAGGP